MTMVKTENAIKKRNVPNERSRSLGTGSRNSSSSNWWKSNSRSTKHVMDKYRARKERKRQATARSLRSYQKACKAAGYSPGQGASRKRRRLTNEDDNAKEESPREDSPNVGEVEDEASSTTLKNESKESNNPSRDQFGLDESARDRKYNTEIETEVDGRKEVVAASGNQTEDGTVARKRRRHGGIVSSKKAAQWRDERRQKVEEKSRNEQERLQKMRERKERSRKMKQRTAKGQPILQYQVQDILQKLQQEQEE